MARSNTILLLGAGILGTIALGAPPAHAAGIPADTVTVKAAAPGFVTDAGYRRHYRYHRYRYRPQILVQPNVARGFYDPGYAYHGNINGCAVDLGYGRYEPCGAGR